MFRLALLPFLVLLSPPAGAVTCAEMQAAFQVPAPEGAESEDPDGSFGCSRAAMAMFEVNAIAVEQAQPVEDLAQLHGTWLGDRVLSYLEGITVPGQEVLVFAPGEAPGTVNVTQYWMKAAAFQAPESLWSEEGRYIGIAAEATLEPDGGGQIVVADYGEAIRYGYRRLEHERSSDLWVKTQLNHFELPFALRLHGDVLVLDGGLRSAVTRQSAAYSRSYTRVAPDAAELALATVMAFEISQGRNFDCLAHQITAGEGPLFEALAPAGIAELDALLRRLIGFGVRRDRLSAAIGAAEKDPAELERLTEEFVATVDAFGAFMEDPANAALVSAVAEGSDRFCPDFF